MGFNTSSIWIKVALICLILATLLFIIGFATNSWMTFSGLDESRFGLWTHTTCLYSRREGCDTRTISKQYLRFRDWTGWYRATQVFECIGLICLLMALLIVLIFVFVDRMRKRSALIALIVFCFVAAVCMAIGFIIFGTQFDSFYGIDWSMVLAILGCVLTFVAGVMGVIDLKK